MKRNLYFRSVIRRENVLMAFMQDAFISLASWPRLILEVFLRRNMGERYFSLASAVTVALFLFVCPLIGQRVSSYAGGSGDSFLAQYGTWYLFLIGFVYFSWLSWQEVKRNPSVFDFSRYSLSDGDIHPVFLNLRISGKLQSIRTIETLIEPAVFFALGLLLWLVGQKLGMLLLVSSIFYSLSYCAAYRKGDNFVMDTIDEMIINEELTSVFVDDASTNAARGVRFHMKKPSTKALRRKVADAFIEEDQDDEGDREALAA